MSREFFARRTPDVARDLLGVRVVRETTEGRTVGRIVEVEAYNGPDDRASHARAGVTRRTEPMFGEVGHAYVYLIYGMHECLNVVAYEPGSSSAGAILLRAIEPLEGADLMRVRRARVADPAARLASGPARLCQAMAVDRTFSGADLLSGGPLRLEPGMVMPDSDVSVGRRVGVDYADEWADRPWRFWITSNASVSRR